jgi:hypothetical protein
MHVPTSRRALAILAAPVAILMLLGAFGGSAQAAVNEVTPSTNEINTANGWAHFVAQGPLDNSGGNVQIQFVSTRPFYSCFEYRSDGDTSQVLTENGGANYNTDVTDGLYPYVCVNGNTATKTLYARHYVEIRMVFGAEQDERFDWTTVPVIDPTPSTNEINTDNGWAHFVARGPLDGSGGNVKIEFVSTRSFYSCFEYRTDGDTSQVLTENGGANYNLGITDGLYPYVCVNNSTENLTLYARHTVEIRMVFGAERTERFDWTTVPVIDPTPSTNEINTANDWAHFVATPDVGRVEVQFVSTKPYYSCFEYRTDGDTSQVLPENGGVNYNLGVTDGLYPYVCVKNSDQTLTLYAHGYVEIRMVFGAERDERFDWTRVNIAATVEQAIEDLSTEIADQYPKLAESVLPVLDNALTAYQQGDTAYAISQLNAAINKIDAQAGKKKIDESDAATLTEQLQDVIDGIPA